VLLILFVVMLMVSFTVSFKRWEGQPPTIRFDREFKSLGRKPPLSVQIEDAGNGLSKIAVSLKQKTSWFPWLRNPIRAVAGYFLANGHKKSATIDLGKLISEKYKVQDGPASLLITASDHSWGGFFGGNQTQQQRDFIFDIYPPRLEVLSSQHYINQGGSECVVYRVSPDAEVSGVQAGPNFFPGYPAGSDPNLRFALFALPTTFLKTAPQGRGARRRRQ
jgi:hypothetical protein